MGNNAEPQTNPRARSSQRCPSPWRLHHSLFSGAGPSHTRYLQVAGVLFIQTGWGRDSNPMQDEHTWHSCFKYSKNAIKNNKYEKRDGTWEVSKDPIMLAQPQAAKHVEWLLVAEFNIDKGSSITHQYPAPTGFPEQYSCRLITISRIMKTKRIQLLVIKLLSRGGGVKKDVGGADASGWSTQEAGRLDGLLSQPYSCSWLSFVFVLLAPFFNARPILRLPRSRRNRARRAPRKRPVGAR